MRELGSECENYREKSSFYFSCPKIARRDKTIGEHPAATILGTVLPASTKT